jgi:phosphoserine phosphatase
VRDVKTFTPDAPPPYATVLFDCDSTLAAVEGIESLVESLVKSGMGTSGDDLEQRVRVMTDQAMDGGTPLEDVFGARLELVRPSRADLEALGAIYTERAMPHGQELVAALRFLGKTVGIVSGGLMIPVAIFARHLGIDAAEVHAVDTLHDDDGAYLDFDRQSPLARSGGKPAVLRAIGAARPGALALVGDGATDLEAALVPDTPCSRFIAYGGVHRRAGVFAAARVCCDTPDLAALLPLLCSTNEIERLASAPAHAALVEAARLAS